MMTFGLNRPVYSFGLLAAEVIVVIGGAISCSFPIEDAREHLIANYDEFKVADMRVYEPGTESRIMRIHDVRSFNIYDDRIELVSDSRVFVVEDERVFYIERDCNDV